ncbi:metal binding domain of Ada-domain-containing protein [Sphaerosporella brunnea]|uniref:Metal binding domain of Ada-domain-containing protein n=1 Tax=Sphaerosporella brunnea TaxID=1250544 RepID=A0A5J5ER60_9PEZI|nr:metal binding domain of Ada-domain-containing protein [Sphaerosporella brunnea]
MLTSAQRWVILQTRDPEYHSAFVYAVKTTNIYCRPTCSARLARRANVLFYNTASAAEAAGYRACKRCHPEIPEWHPRLRGLVERAKGIIEAGKEEIGLKTLAGMVGASEWHLLRQFKKEVGVTPRGYWTVACQQRRGEAAVDELMREIEMAERDAPAADGDEFVDWDGGQ